MDKSYKSDLILFTNLGRFSSNAGDAYQMISFLADLGITKKMKKE